MAENKATLLVLKWLLANKRTFAEAALVSLYERQTADEQTAKQTTEHNGVGFNGTDAEFLSSLAVRVKTSSKPAGFRLTDTQALYAHKKLPKYAAQLMRYSAPEKLAVLVAKYEAQAKVALLEKVADATAEAVITDSMPVMALTSGAAEDALTGNEFGKWEAEQERQANLAIMAYKQAMEVAA